MRTSHTGPRDWDAEVYDEVARPQLEWSEDVLARLDLGGGETVLDAGCGSGRVTARLLERVPRGRVIGVDASPSMVAKARERLGPRAEIHLADLSELELDSPVDAIFSNAVFHWILDHDRLFARLHALLVPGGTLTAQCGGKGNVANLSEAVRAVIEGEPRFGRYLTDSPPIWNFATPTETEARLTAVGFADVRCWLEPRPVRPERPLDFLATVTLGPFLDRLPASLRDGFVRKVAAEMREPLTLDYVRLNIDARRALR
jgi:trans-aconitate 2-methyltransferase